MLIMIAQVAPRGLYPGEKGRSEKYLGGGCEESHRGTVTCCAGDCYVPAYIEVGYVATVQGMSDA